MRKFSLLLLSLGACAWTEFDDLRDEAWVVAITKPEDSDATNWGVAMAGRKVDSDSGGTLAIFGTAPSRQHDTTFDFKGKPTLLEQDLGDLGIANLAIEPVVIEDPSGTDFSIVTQGSSMQVVVAHGQGINLVQSIVNDAGIVDAAVYMVPPTIDTAQTRGARAPQPAQPLIASGEKLFGTFFDPEPQFQQVRCQLVFGGIPTAARALGAVRIDPVAETTDDIAVWGGDGNMYVLDGHIFNGHRAGLAGGNYPGDFLCPSVGGAADVEGVLDPRAILAGPTAVDFTPGANTLAQILKVDDTHAILQGHDQNDGFLLLWDFAANAPVGGAIREPGLRAAAIYNDGTNVFVVAGYPNTIVDGVNAGQAKVFRIDLTAGIAVAAEEVFHDAQPEDGQAFGRSLATFEFNGQQIIAIGASNEVFTYFRTRAIYPAETRQ